MDRSSNETKSQESYISSQDTLTSLGEIQQWIISFDNSLRTMWYRRDAKSRQHVLFIKVCRFTVILSP